jgi:hypothetical protein
MHRLNKNNASMMPCRLRIDLCRTLLAAWLLCLSGFEPPKVNGDEPEESQWDEVLQDDELDGKQPVFDKDLIDSRIQGGWFVNSSDAVIKLDTPTIRVDLTPQLAKLYPSYRVARNEAPNGKKHLVSVNMLDAKGKQFDDGLYAALDQAYFQGLQDRLPSHVAFVRRIFDKCNPDSEAAAFLAAGLLLANQNVTASNARLRSEYLKRFNRNNVESKPISFYTWNETLQNCWRFLKFFQQSLHDHPDIAEDIAAIIKADASLQSDYQRALNFYAGLTNPPGRGNLLDRSTSGDVSLFPPSTSRENELFQHLYEFGMSPESNLMRDLITQIKSGKIDLAPRDNSGWYDYQAFALETFLLPERGTEKDKLLLTRLYKKRMQEAFQTIVTSRRETHARQMKSGGFGGAPAVKPELSPRLRVEPSPSFYLRNARAYAFLQKFLTDSIGEEVLSSLHGLTEDGQRPETLSAELESMKRLFYGMYLISCEDIGLRSELSDEESLNSDACYKQAEKWLERPWNDPDLAIDRRVSIPIGYDRERRVTRIWMIVGVRILELNASYAIAPKIRPANDDQIAWEVVERSKLEPQNNFIAVDEFAEVELKGNVSLSRVELRKICNRYDSKDEIIKALQR